MLLQIEEDKLTKVAKAHWQGEQAQSKPFDPELVKRIYDSDLHGGQKTPPPLRPVMLLEVSQVCICCVFALGGMLAGPSLPAASSFAGLCAIPSCMCT